MMRQKIFSFLLFILIFISQSSYARDSRDFVRKGNRLMKDTVYSKAQVEYQKAIEMDNTSAIAHYNLGNALLFQGKAEDAMKEYEIASKLELNKNRLSKIYHNMGYLLQAAKQFDKAVVCYKHSLRNNPTSDQTRYNYALCLFQLKNSSNSSQDNQQKDEEGKDEKSEKDQQKQEKKAQRNDQKEEQNEQPNPEKMSKENAEQMLNAAMQNEKSVQEKIQRAQQNQQRKHLQKQW